MTKLYAGLAAATVLALIAGTGGWILLNRPTDAFSECRGGQVAGGDIGGPFTLVNAQGQTVTD